MRSGFPGSSPIVALSSKGSLSGSRAPRAASITSTPKRRASPVGMATPVSSSFLPTGSQTSQEPSGDPSDRLGAVRVARAVLDQDGHGDPAITLLEERHLVGHPARPRPPAPLEE